MSQKLLIKLCLICACSDTISHKIAGENITQYLNALGENISKGFSSLTGCDATTGMLGITKHAAFQNTA